MSEEIAVITDTIILPSKVEVLKFHLATKFMRESIHYTDSELDILVYMSVIGGYNEDDAEAFITDCVANNFRKSYTSVSNVISKFVKLGVIEKVKKKVRRINPSYLPNLDSEIVGLKYTVFNKA